MYERVFLRVWEKWGGEILFRHVLKIRKGTALLIVNPLKQHVYPQGCGMHRSGVELGQPTAVLISPIQKYTFIFALAYGWLSNIYISARESNKNLTSTDYCSCIMRLPFIQCAWEIKYGALTWYAVTLLQWQKRSSSPLTYFYLDLSFTSYITSKEAVFKTRPLMGERGW